MNENDRQNEWTIVAAIALVALGVWFLLGNVFGSAWREAIRHAMSIAWPIALIALGVLLLVTTRRGGAGHQPGVRLYRSRDRMVGGVLAGIADYFGIDPTVVRVLYVLFGFLVGVWPAILVYIVAMIVIPESPKAGAGAAPAWPDFGGTTVSQPPNPSSGWPHTGTETVQTPPSAPAPPTASGEPPVPTPPGTEPSAPEPEAPDAPPAERGE